MRANDARRNTTDEISQGLQGGAAHPSSRRVGNRALFDNNLPPAAERQFGKTR
jgi:hypothetical protein